MTEKGEMVLGIGSVNLNFLKDTFIQRKLRRKLAWVLADNALCPATAAATSLACCKRLLSCTSCGERFGDGTNLNPLIPGEEFLKSAHA